MSAMIYVSVVSFSACPSCYDDMQITMEVRRAFTNAQRADEWGMELELRRVEAWEMFREEYGIDAPLYPEYLTWEGSLRMGVELEA